MAIIAFAAFGTFILALIAVVSVHGRRRATQRQYVAIQRRRRQAAERDIAEIGQATRAAIMDEVQRQLRQGRS